MNIRTICGILWIQTSELRRRMASRVTWYRAMAVLRLLISSTSGFESAVGVLEVVCMDVHEIIKHDVEWPIWTGSKFTRRAALFLTGAEQCFKQENSIDNSVYQSTPFYKARLNGNGRATNVDDAVTTKHINISSIGSRN